jgi:hypothetical protein
VKLKDPPANISPEAVRLRKAAITFARNIGGPVIDMDDTLGHKLNRALLRAAVAYAQAASRSKHKASHRGTIARKTKQKHKAATPVMIECSECDGSGEVQAHYCRSCGGTGLAARL